MHEKLIATVDVAMVENPTALTSIIPVDISLNGSWEFYSPSAGTESLVSSQKNVVASDEANLSQQLRPHPDALANITNAIWVPIKVPSNWFLEGHDIHGVAWYRHRFSIDSALADKNIRLIFDGIDYAADVWLNGEYLGFHEGYFQSFDVPITSELRANGKNELLVRVNSPLEPMGEDWSLNKRLIKGIFSHHDTRPGGAWSERGQEQNTGGIWAPVHLHVADTVAIQATEITPSLDKAHDRASASVTLALSSLTRFQDDVDIKFQLIPKNFVGPSKEWIQSYDPLKQGEQTITAKLVLEHPKLWWTWDHGTPNLYTLVVEVMQNDSILDRAKQDFGFRTIEYDDKQQVWLLNGKRLFVRGTNYIPTQWLSEMDAGKYEFDVGLMTQANINAVRVHAHISGPEFYKACDRAGLLVWQDFPLQWGYTESPTFATEAIRQGKDMIHQLYNHPSIMAWSLHNEPPWDADWMQYKYDNYNPEQNKQLDEILYASLKGIDPSRHLHKYSSLAEHPWWGWYSFTLHKYAEPTDQALITEYGAQALPNIESLRRMFTEDELWPDSEEEWQKWDYHNFQRRETFDIAQVDMGANPQEFVDNSQAYQAKLTQFAAEAYRRQRFQPVSAIFQFMFVEDWPSMNWGIVDYWRQPKPGYKALKTAYQPLLPSIEWDRDVYPAGKDIQLKRWLVNDQWKQVPNVTVITELTHNWHGLKKNQQTIDIEADSVVQLDNFVYHPSELGEYTLTLKVTDRHHTLLGQNSFTFRVTQPEA
ncbi:MAG: glycoside hydrolase family 2 TIM barrel-domain containing protein [Cyanobacteria bacterium P01_F01_bin.150]